MLFDSHAHMDSSYGEGGKEAIKRAQDNNVFFVSVGADLKSSKEAVFLAQKSPQGIYAAVGCHPENVSEETDLEKFSALLTQEKVVAVGEVGLDYFRLVGEPKKEKQKEIFQKFLNMAGEKNLPVILHCRGEATSPLSVYNDVLKIIKESEIRRGTVHCFGGALAQAREFIGLGFFIGITGIITFNKKSESLREIVRALPLKNLLIETDAPYLSPEPYRGRKNEPVFVSEIARIVAETKGISETEAERATFQNAVDLFNINNYN